MVVPAYCRSRSGCVYRVRRVVEELGPERMRYTLRATPLTGAEPAETSREIDAALLRDMIAHRQIVPTPEDTFEQLWQQLRLDVDAVRTSVEETD
jgi:hypothetical protein